MKKKLLSAMLPAALLTAIFFQPVSAAPDDPEDDLPDPTGEYSAEYVSSPFYEKLLLALENSADKTTMEKTLAAALSQEGYQNYATQDIDVNAARSDGLIWTGKELRMSNGTGNTEYTRWAQNVLMNRTGSALYLDCDWCAIFASWCMYQAGYYTDERLSKYYYSYCADPRVEYDYDSWITAFCLEQENVWYTPLAAYKQEAYDWNTYYHSGVDPFEIPYSPGGLIFFSWDGSGRYFDHVAIVVSYDPETHVLTYTNGNSGGQVITKQMDLDTEEEFYGQPLLQNSERIMAYAEYDEILPLEQKEITVDNEDIIWYQDADRGIRIQTDSDSKIASVFVDGEYLGSNVESNMVLNFGRLSIGKSELIGLETGVHEMRLVFDDGVISVTLTIEDTKEITAEPSDITWDRSDEDIVIRTNSSSETVEIRVGEASAASGSTEGITLTDGTVTVSKELANTLLSDGQNTAALVFTDGEKEIGIFVTDESKQQQSSEPSEQPSQPSEQSSEQSSESSEQSSDPTEQSSQTSEQSSEPSEQSSEQLSESSEQSSDPTEQSLQTSEQSSEPSEQSSEQSSDPTEQSSQTSEQSSESSEQSSDPTEQSSDPSEFNDEPSESGESRIKPGTNTVDTGDASPTAVILLVLAGSLAAVFVPGVRRRRNHDDSSM